MTTTSGATKEPKDRPNHINNNKNMDDNGSKDDDDDDELKQTIHGTKVEDQQKSVSFTKLMSLAYPERYPLLVALFLMIVAEGLGLVIPLLIANAYDVLVDTSLTPSQRMSDINQTMIYALLLHVVSLTAQYLRAVIMGAAGVRLVARTRNRLYQSILKQEIAFFDVTKTGELASRLGSDTGLLEEGISTALPEVTIGGIVVTVSIAIMFWISWKLALLMVGFLVVILCVCAPFGVLLGQLSKSYQDYLGLAQTHSTEALAAIRTVQSFAAEDKELDRYQSVIGQPENYKYWWPTNYKSRPTTYSYAFFKSHFTVLLYIIIFGLGFGALYVVLWFGLKLVNDGDLSLGKLTAFQSYIFQIGASLGQTSQFVAKLIETQGAASRLFYLMERIPAIPTPPRANHSDSEHRDNDHNMDPNGNNTNLNDVEDPQRVAPTTLSSVHGAVDFNNVSFAYPTRPNSKVLHNFSVSIAPNQTAAFVGASGAGKTTIIGLLQRFYDVSDGSVTLDGHDIRTLDIKWLRSQMAYVQQEPQLFGLTIRENITYGDNRENITQEEIEAVAKEANAHDFISQFPDGYDTLVGERGIQLSGGQKQRIAIARALLPQPRLLLLDEATSALDAESEHLVQEAIDKAVIGRTVLIVAHRLSTVQRANQIVVLDDHKIVDVGTHSELLDRCSKYQELIKRQALIGSIPANRSQQ